MPRPSQLGQQRRDLLPVVARAFAELGYRRATTAELARRCGVQQNILYRLWPDKQAMFIAALRYVYELSAATWRRLVRTDAGRAGARGKVPSGRPAADAAERLLSYESLHHGEFGHYRIVFAGLSETDDPRIRAALTEMYLRFQRFLRTQILARRCTPGPAPGGSRANGALDPALAAWALVGVGTVVNLGRELGLLSPRQRRRLLTEVGRLLLDASAGTEGPRS